MVKRIWEWYGIAGGFFLGVWVVFLGGFGASAWLGAKPLARMLIAPTVGLVGVAVVLAVICLILSTKQPWEPDLKLGGKSLVLGGAVGLFLIGGAVWLLCHTGRGTNGPQTVILALQTLVLAITAGFVVWYAVAAQRSAEAQEELTEATLRIRTGLFVEDPIWTVKKCAERNEESDVTDDCEFIKENWLAVEIVNEGKFRAVNVTLAVSEKWVEGSHANAKERADMQCLDDFTPRRDLVKKLDDEINKIREWGGKEVKVWRRWDLRPGQSIIACWCPPPDKITDEERVLILHWSDPSYIGWTSTIRVNEQKDEDEKQGKWTTDWARAKPVRD